MMGHFRVFNSHCHPRSHQIKPNILPHQRSGFNEPGASLFLKNFPGDPSILPKLWTTVWERASRKARVKWEGRLGRMTANIPCCTKPLLWIFLHSPMFVSKATWAATAGGSWSSQVLPSDDDVHKWHQNVYTNKDIWTNLLLYKRQVLSQDLFHCTKKKVRVEGRVLTFKVQNFEGINWELQPRALSWPSILPDILCCSMLEDTSLPHLLPSKATHISLAEF